MAENDEKNNHKGTLKIMNFGYTFNVKEIGKNLIPVNEYAPPEVLEF